MAHRDIFKFQVLRFGHVPVVVSSPRILLDNFPSFRQTSHPGPFMISYVCSRYFPRHLLSRTSSTVTVRMEGPRSIMPEQGIIVIYITMLHKHYSYSQ